MTQILRPNQIQAINISKENDFQSGIHYHATGTGKSWIAMYILKEYYTQYPKNNVFWICERKDILSQQFSKETIKNRNFTHILKNYNVLDFSQYKNDKWYDSLNSAIFWGKPYLCIINRQYLTSQNKYQNIKNKVSLIIHDECHSIENKSTQDFYTYIENKFKPKIIGFSATPEIKYPLENILSKYSIYNAFLDNVILPPKIVWLKSENKLQSKDIYDSIIDEINKLPYKKIIVWCGIIEECLNIANQWRDYFKNYQICLDFNNIDRTQYQCFGDFNDFYRAENNSILFCAIKHREGSDIPNVDACIFMDLVEKRSERVFIQCMGRILRKDSNQMKHYGLVIDLKARSTIEVCNRVQYYLKLKDVFPWKYSIVKKANIYINYLDMVEASKCEKIIEKEFNKTYTREDISSYFVRQVPALKSYQERLDYELDLIISKNLFGNMVRAIEILKMTKDIPHITRGSCGSSLVCYLLGISHVDPIKYKISFARFINSYRDTLPDIDFDFPHYLRDEVFLKLFQKWGHCVARISNHNYYHEKSALRESLRLHGINKFISKYDIKKEINSYDEELQDDIYRTQKNLEGQFRGYSLHCGGIIYFPNGIPEDLLLDNNKSILPQVCMNKIDVSDNKNFKIDILSSRGLSQLYYCHNLNSINFNAHIGDTETIKLLCSGDNIGITLAETPLMRKALLLIKPKSIMDLAICLSIIRPAAKDAKKEFELGNYKRDNLIFDDDIIHILSRLLNCGEEMADKYRRNYCKNKNDCVKTINSHISKQSPAKRAQLKKVLNNLRKYGFCKAHALSYAQLVWQLAYMKAHHPKKFWMSTLKNVESCYRKWVHIYEAKCHDISLPNNDKHRSIYAQHKSDSIINYNTQIQQLKKFGFWDMTHTQDTFYKNCYYFKTNEFYIFRGLIASSRTLSYGKNKTNIIFIGVSKNQYIEIVVNGNIYYNAQKVLVKGKGKLTNKLYNTITCEAQHIEFI